MDRPPHQQVVLVASDIESPFISESAGGVVTPEVDLALSKRDTWSDREPPAPALTLAVERAAPTQSVNDLREIFLRRHNEASTRVAVSGARIARLARTSWASLQSRFPLDNRMAAAVGLFVVAFALLFVVTRFGLAPSPGTAPTAAERFASAVSGVIGGGSATPAAPLTTVAATPPETEAAAPASGKNVASARPAVGQRGPINSSRTHQLMPFVTAETVLASVPARIGADIVATSETRSPEAPALALNVSTVDATVGSIVGSVADSVARSTTESAGAAIIYSTEDADVSPPVAIRSPGLATDRMTDTRYISFVEILVSETGRVEWVKRQRQPATLGAAFQSSTALSAVKTWVFRPARKQGQPVKYRTVVPFLETLYPAGTVDGSR